MNKIGLIAGKGRFPFLISEEIRRIGDQVVAIGIKEETDKELESLVNKISWISLGQFQKLIDFFHIENVSTAIMAGHVKHSNLFAGFKLDWRAIKLLGKLANKKTDSILTAVAEELAKEGINLLPSHLYLKHLLPEKGILCGGSLSKSEKADVEFGFKTAKQIAGLDIGQTIVVKDLAVIAVESMEGTDECIRRASKFGRENTVVVKVAKPNQDWRFDIPVIGPNTINVLKESKVKILAIESGSTLMIDKEHLLETAKKNKITIISY